MVVFFYHVTGSRKYLGRSFTERVFLRYWSEWIARRRWMLRGRRSTWSIKYPRTPRLL